MSAQGRVSLRGIRKVYGRFTALDGIDLDIEPVEFFALLGPSGSGKTTTLRMIAGLDTPDEGTLTADGVDITFAPPGERDVAMVFQNYALYPHMTVHDNIAFPLRMVKVDSSSIDALVREAAARVRIDHLLHRRPGQLSGGQQQRCALARAIVRKPKLFLLDEPLSNLDAQLRLETRVELRKLQRNLNVTTIYVTHDQEEAMTLADRMAVFLEGSIKQVGTPAEIFDRPNCVEVAFGNMPDLMPGAESTYQSYGVAWANMSNTPFRLYKHWTHEGGVSTPVIFHWPNGIGERGGLRHTPCQLPDVMATVIELAGAEYPVRRDGHDIPPLEGASLVPVIERDELPERPLFWEHEGNAAVRLGRWKLVKEYPGDWELYDMLEDRTETNDIASRHPALVKDLATRYDEWAERCGVIPRDRVLEMMRNLPGKAFWEEDPGWEVPERGRPETDRD